jgi:putative transposase
MKNLPKRRNSLRYSAGNYSYPSGNYFVTICVTVGVDLISPKLTNAIIETLEYIENLGNAKFPCYCIMPDHIHLIIQLTTGGKSVSDIVWSLKRSVTRKSGYEGGTLWQRSFYDRIIRDYNEYVEIANYIADNPVKRGYIKDGEDYQLMKIEY